MRDIKFIGKNNNETLYEDFVTERSDNDGSDTENIIKELAFKFIPDQSNYDDTEYVWNTWDVDYETLMNYETDLIAFNFIKNRVKETGVNHILFQFF